MNEDKYTSETDQVSGVRNIISQLTEEQPSKEKSRELVVRKDGTRMVRVVKKKRVAVSEEDKRRKSRKSFFGTVTVAAVVVGILLGFFILRMAMMSGSSYLEDKQDELLAAWGAESLEIGTAEIDGFVFKVDAMTLRFPADHLIERVEVTDLRSELSASSFLSSKLVADELKIGTATFYLRGDAKTMNMPQLQGSEFWEFARINCAHFSLYLGDAASPQFSIENSSAYMYYPQANRAFSSIVINRGTFEAAGWKRFDIKELRARLTTSGVEDISFSLVKEGRNREVIGNAAIENDSSASSYHMRLAGSITNGASFAGPYKFSSGSVPVSELSNGRLSSFFSALTCDRVIASSDARGSQRPTQEITFSETRAYPSFKGELPLKEIKWRNLPGMGVLCKHIFKDKRDKYSQIFITQGLVQFESTPERVSMSFPEINMSERFIVSLKGSIAVNKASELTGKLDYGVTYMLTREEYPGDISDPIFTEDDSTTTAWLNTSLSGTVLAPSDDSEDQEARAELDRSKRGARRNLDMGYGELESELKERANSFEKAAEGAGNLTPTDNSLIMPTCGAIVILPDSSRARMAPAPSPAPAAPSPGGTCFTDFPSEGGSSSSSLY